MPIFPMTHPLLRSAAVLALLALPAWLSAEETSSKEEERLEALTRDDAGWYVPKTTLSVGFRVLSSGAKVNFGNLGIVASNVSIAPAFAGRGTRAYNNGTVGYDAPRASELDSNGNQVSTPGGTYKGTSTANGADGSVTTTVVTELLSFTPGLTRNWSYTLPDQVTNSGYIAMSYYSATSGGASAVKKQGATGGVDFQLNRTMGKLGPRLEWGFAAGVTLNDINNKARGTVLATLHTNTDFYSLNGKPAPAVPGGTAYADFKDAAGNVLTSSGLEITTPLAAVADTSLSTSTTTPGGVSVTGRWQLRGEYLMLRLGPSLHSQLTDRLGLNASLGVALGYAGTRYTADESMAVPGLPDVTIDTGTEVSTATKLVSGYFADFSMEWAANERTGIYGGLGTQKLSDYQQTVGGRTARVDIGSAMALRGGINIKF